MSSREKPEEPEFRWGRKRGKDKDVQFYESFTYDEVDYTLYDCVFISTDDRTTIYIGKLVKIWENADKDKLVDIHWYFRPGEISYYLGDTKVLENELFFASGSGNGLRNLNALERSNWIKLPWEEKMKAAYGQGRLVLLQNLNPKYTSGEVEDIIWSALKEECTARMVQHTATYNAQSGQAFAIFNMRDAADRVMIKLNDRCLILPNQRPLVATTGVFHKLEKEKRFVGHLAIDKARNLIQRESKEAVSTSHYSQNNTIEYEMAMDWCLLQARSDRWWKTYYEQQNEGIRKLVDQLKSK